MKSFVALTILISALVHIQDVSGSSCHCEVQYEPVGCYADFKSDRAMPDYILSERDNTVSVFRGYWVDWRNWDNYMREFACRCAMEAKIKGHTLFGLQFYGECWSSPDAENTFNKHGESWKLSERLGKKVGCVGPGFEQCLTNKKTHCVGREITNFVYKLKKGCFDDVVSVGCFRDKSNRAMPDYFSTDRDPSISIFTGISINWFWYDSYMITSLLCRCAQKARELGFKVFGLQYYGECWGGHNALDTYVKYGESSNCIDACYAKCKPSSRFCIGKHFANYVYRFSVEKEECAVAHEAVGCRQAPALSASRLLLSDDPSSRQFTGYSHLTKPAIPSDKRLPELTCSCAFKAKAKGFPYFGMLAEGECYGLREGDLRGESANCFGDFDKSIPCNGNEQCGGASGSMWVIKISSSAKRETTASKKASDILEEVESL